MSRLAVELTPTTLRAARARRFGRGVSRAVEVPWSPERPAAGVAALQSALGTADSIALVVGLGLLHVARVDLPPAPHAERERMLALEPERYFLADEPVAVALAPGSQVAFAVSRSLVDGWTAAFTVWGPVTRIDAAPVAVARALGRDASGTFALDAGPDAGGLLTVDGGHAVAVRRIGAGGSTESARALPARAGVPAELLASWGAILGEDSSQDGTLWPDDRRRAADRLFTRRTLTAGLAAVAALVLAGASYDRWQERTLAELTAEGEQLTREAGPALESRQRLVALAEEVALLREVAARRPDPSAALAAIGLALPRDAVVVTAKASDADWQIEGTARSAASLVPRFDQAGPFENVRALGASSRFLDGNRSRETFSLAFRVPTRR